MRDVAGQLSAPCQERLAPETEWGRGRPQTSSLSTGLGVFASNEVQPQVILYGPS